MHNYSATWWKRQGLTRKWVQSEAIELIRKLQPKAWECGFAMYLGGGVLNKGESPNDLDILVMPDTKRPLDISGLLETFGRKVLKTITAYPGICVYKLDGAIDLIVPLIREGLIHENKEAPQQQRQATSAAWEDPPASEAYCEEAQDPIWREEPEMTETITTEYRSGTVETHDDAAHLITTIAAPISTSWHSYPSSLALGHRALGELLLKFVSEAFKEIHQKEWKGSNPTQNDVVQSLIAGLRTPARWGKAVQHLKEAGKIEGSPRDIGLLVKETQEDIERECAELIKDELYKWAMPHIRRGVVAGLPEWYKECFRICMMVFVAAGFVLVMLWCALAAQRMLLEFIR